MHAFTGCDTTSSIFGLGKLKIVKLMAKSFELQQCALVFSDNNATQKNVGDAGARAFVILYGANPKNTSLNKLRYVRYNEMIASSKKGPIPERLPPTANAAYYHSLRVHEQILAWKK